MKEFKRFSLQLLVAAAVAMSGFVSCSDPNYELGQNFLPDGHDMSVGSMSFAGIDATGRRVISTRNYYTDKINSANQPVGMIGAQYDDHFGTRLSGFYSQYIPMYALPEDEDEFGYDPILDSVCMHFSLSNFSGDTTVVNKFVVYEVLDDAFLGDYDTADAEDRYETNSESIVEEFKKDGVLSEPMFTFQYPDQLNGVYINSNTVRLNEMSEAGRDFIGRLMLLKGDYNYEIYNGDYADFVKAFKGIYIRPSDDNELNTTDASGDGATYGISFENSGFSFYARSKYKEDPTLIKDTVGMTFTFRDKEVIGGGTSINTTERDYTGKNFSKEDVKSESNPTVEPTGVISVEGMGGIISELTFEQSLFEQFEEAITAAGSDYHTIFFNTVRMTINNPNATEYGVYDEDPLASYKLDDMVARLVFYTNYNSFLNDKGEYLAMETAIDYNFSSESSTGAVSTIDGTLNRSRGCYTLNIPVQMQDFWNDYQDAKEANGGKKFTQSEWDAMEWNKLYLAPDMNNLFTPRYTILQGQEDDENVTPIRLDITYTLLKR